MTPQIRYQIFVSSTYDDLREERAQATQAILEAGYFPSGMELFPASNESQWDLIKRVIEEADYYIVIVGGRYGSIGPAGLSYTEMEYDYAVAADIPVLGFVRDNLDDVPAGKTEKSEAGRTRLISFRDKVMSKTCRKYSSPAELGMAVIKSLMSEARVRPRTGWVRADYARSEEDINRERRLEEDIREAKKKIGRLERQLRDRAVLAEEIEKSSLAQGDDELVLEAVYQSSAKELVTDQIMLSWNDILRVIGPSLYGFIVRKNKSYGDRVQRYEFETDLEEYIRRRIIDKVQGRKIQLQSWQIDMMVMHLKELGLLEFSELDDDDGPFRGVTLSEEGERQLARLNAQVRKPRSWTPAFTSGAERFFVIQSCWS